MKLHITHFVLNDSDVFETRHNNIDVIVLVEYQNSFLIKLPYPLQLNLGYGPTKKSLFKSRFDSFSKMNQAMRK